MPAFGLMVLVDVVNSSLQIDSRSQLASSECQRLRGAVLISSCELYELLRDESAMKLCQIVVSLLIQSLSSLCSRVVA